MRSKKNYNPMTALNRSPWGRAVGLDGGVAKPQMVITIGIDCHREMTDKTRKEIRDTIKGAFKDIQDQVVDKMVRLKKVRRMLDKCPKQSIITLDSIVPGKRIIKDLKVNS